MLQKVRTHGDWEVWLLFFVDAIAATANQAVSTTQELNQLLASDKLRLAALSRLVNSATQIIDALFAHPIANIAALTKANGVTAATIGKALDAMQDQRGVAGFAPFFDIVA